MKIKRFNESSLGDNNFYQSFDGLNMMKDTIDFTEKDIKLVTDIFSPTEIDYPKMDNDVIGISIANNLYRINITKKDDEWYYLNIKELQYYDIEYYKVDQLEGLKQILKDILSKFSFENFTMSLYNHTGSKVMRKLI